MGLVIMEINTVSIVTFLLTVVYYAGKQLYRSLPERAHELRKKRVLLLPRKCGKTQLCQKLESIDKNLRIVDLDESVKALIIGNAKEQLHLAWGEQHKDKNVSADIRKTYVLRAIEDVKKTWLSKPDRKVIFVSSDVEVVLDEFKATSITVAIPSINFANQLMKSLSDKDKEVFLESRKEFQQLERSKHNLPFDTMSELKQKAIEIFKSLKYKV